ASLSRVGLLEHRVRGDSGLCRELAEYLPVRNVLIALPIGTKHRLRERDSRPIARVASAVQMARSEDASKGERGLDRKPARPPKRKPGRLRVARMVAPQI